ncbi:MAG: hypothetical protein A3I06_05860 [Candidatus Lindowbacteria bacterium RIFCSPLOWO2_02_FULL_62_12]|nr:MAG: hypothetical protein A3I06_05860 [Candidatus Lindowbacteria bacterium RIFCSPLOWO2_02_FULL_62_12]
MAPNPSHTRGVACDRIASPVSNTPVSKPLSRAIEKPLSAWRSEGVNPPRSSTVSVTFFRNGPGVPSFAFRPNTGR